MTNSSISPSAPKLPLPLVARVLYTVTPLMILFGGFLYYIQNEREFDWAKFQTMLGLTLFWVGIAGFFTAVIISSMRSLSQQQLEALLDARDIQE